MQSLQMIEKQKIKKQQLGLTLLELMFAVGLLTFVLSSMFTSVVYLGANREIETERLQAESIANEILDQISRLDRTQLLTFNAPEPEYMVGRNMTIQVVAIGSDGSEISIPVVGNSSSINLPNLVEVQVTITWTTARGYTMTKRVSTYVSG